MRVLSLINANRSVVLQYFFGTSNISFFIPDEEIPQMISFAIRSELTRFIKFYMGIVKGAGFSFGLVLQILAVVYLVRGNSGYSRSARNWFLIVLGADIGSTLYRVYELMTDDFFLQTPQGQLPHRSIWGRQFAALMWGLRRKEDQQMQEVFCRVFFIILYLPIFLSPIALTVSSLIRCYCVKFPLRAKAVLTTRVDRLLIAFTVGLSLAIAVIIVALAVDAWSSSGIEITTLGDQVFYGECVIPTYRLANTDKNLLFIGMNFMLAIIFLICAFNILSAIVIILVLFEAKKNRRSMSANESTDSKAEVKATAMLLGMNITLFICFFMSRLLLVISTRIDIINLPVQYVILERLSAYLFHIPYYTNSFFIAAFSSKFYEFYMPCLFRKETKTPSAVSQKTMEESKMG